MGNGNGAEEEEEEEGDDGAKQGPFISPPVQRELGRKGEIGSGVAGPAVELRDDVGTTVGEEEGVALTTQGPVFAPLVQIEIVSVRLLPVGTIVRDVRFVVVGRRPLLVEFDSGEDKDVAVALPLRGADELDSGNGGGADGAMLGQVVVAGTGTGTGTLADDGAVPMDSAGEVRDEFVPRAPVEESAVELAGVNGGVASVLC